MASFERYCGVLYFFWFFFFCCDAIGRFLSVFALVGGFFSRENVVQDVLREVRFTIAIGREIKGSMKHHANRGNLPGA